MDFHFHNCIPDGRADMKKPRIEPRHMSASYKSYVIGFVLSIISTLLAYFFVVNGLFPKDQLVYIILFIAVVQLVIQMVFFLHIGRGSRWKLLTFVFTVLFVLIIVVGTIWVMNHLNYNMMHMSPDEMHQYMKENEGI